jgi:hypothetical protein
MWLRSPIEIGFFIMLASLIGVVIYSLMIAAKIPRKSLNWQAVMHPLVCATCRDGQCQ